MRASVQGWEQRSYQDKLKLALDLGILEADHRRFLAELGKLRNRVVHQLEHITFDLHEYNLSRKGIEARNWNQAMGAGWKDMTSLEFFNGLSKALRRPSSIDPDLLPYLKEMSIRDSMVAMAPRAAIWWAGVWTMDSLAAWLYSRRSGDDYVLDPDLKPTLQDLLLEPDVLQFKRTLHQELFNKPGEVPDHQVCGMLLWGQLMTEMVWLLRRNGINLPPD